MNTDIILTVSDIQRFCMHDGPGIRTTVFLKGCPLRCAWCHNPETQKSSPELLFYKSKCICCSECVSLCANKVHLIKEDHLIYRNSCSTCGACADNCPTGALEISGKRMSVDEVISAVEKDRSFYGENGGITLSGGEPFYQAEACIALLKSCKERGISTAVETCGYADKEILLRAAPYVDIFLWDIKDTDSSRHKRYTGVRCDRILDNLNTVSGYGSRIRLRCILVNGVNTEISHYENLSEIALKIKNLDGVEFLPYHAYAGNKATLIGKEDNGVLQWIPTEKQLTTAKDTLKNRGLPVF